MRLILSLAILGTVLTSSNVYARHVYNGDATADVRPSAQFNADATRNWYRLNGDAHSTIREENGTSSWEGAGPFAGNPNGN